MITPIPEEQGIAKPEAPGKKARMTRSKASPRSARRRARNQGEGKGHKRAAAGVR